MIYKSYLVEQNLNNILGKICLFYGENIGLKNEFKEKLKRIKKEFTYLNFNQDEILKNNSILFNEINNLSLFEKEKIIFIENSNDKILETIKIVIDGDSRPRIFLFAEKLDKKSKLRSLFEKENRCGIIACYPDNEITIKKIINERLKEFSNLTSYDINLIKSNSSLDRVKLNNELSKITTYFSNKKIDTQELEKILDPTANDNFADLADTALMGKKEETNELLSETIIDQDKNIYYLNLINSKLNKILDIKKLSKDGNIETAINQIKPPIFWKDKPKITQQVKKWHNDKIKKILGETYDIELKMKTGKSTNNNAFIKKLIIDICVIANA